MQKKVFRNLFCTILGIVMLLSIFPFNALAASAVITVSGSNSVTNGEEFTVGVDLSGNSGFAGFNFTLNYDAAVFDYVSNSAGTYTFTSDANSQSGSVTVAAMGASNITGDGTLMRFTFKAKENTSAESKFSVKVNEFFDENMDDISIQTNDLTTSVQAKQQESVSSYEVKFNSNGGGAVSSQTVAAGEKAVEPSVPKKIGYTFDGWYTSADLKTRYNFSAAVSGNITLYAKWTENAPTQYTVSFDSNGGSTVESQKVTEGQKASEPSEPTKSGYKFVGWYTTSSLKAKYDFSETVTTNTTLYAKWEYVPSGVAHSIIFEGGKGAKGDAPEGISDKKYGELFKLPDNTFSKDGYEFDGWYDGKKVYDAGSTYTMPDNSITFTARWYEANDTSKVKKSGGKSSTKASGSVTAEKSDSEKKSAVNTSTEDKNETTEKSSTSAVNEERSSVEVRVSIGTEEAIVGDKSYNMGVAPYIQKESSSTLVPLRFVAVALCGDNADNPDNSNIVVWDAEYKKATVNANGKVVVFRADSPYMVIDGKEVLMDNNVKAEIRDSRMFIPFRALGNALGVKVDWDATSKTAVFKMN